MSKQVSFVVSTQGNPISLKRTLESFKNICSEFIVGSLCVFKEDEELIESYKNEYNIKVIKLPFDSIYRKGFSAILNILASHASNDLCLYNNVGEVVDGEERVLRLINEKFPDYNCYAIDHAKESHVWTRLWNRKELAWSGMIHEEIVNIGVKEKNLCPYFIFRFKDTDKDSNPFKAKVFNDIKEICYFRQYIRLIENPELQGATNDWWVQFAKENYESMKHRLFDKRARYEAFEEGNLQKYLDDVYNNPLFRDEKFESNQLVEFQNSSRSL